MKTAVLMVLCLLVSSLTFSQGLRLKTDTIPTWRSPRLLKLNCTPGSNAPAIPMNFYTQHLGFFCRQELKCQQAHIPVAFRLGSMDYCNYLEQKPGYR